MKTRYLLILLLLPLSVQAGLYKYTDKNGEVIYSDEPPYVGAEEVELPEIMITPAFKYTPSKKAAPEEKKPEAIKYTSFSITFPANNEIIRDNAGRVGINVTLAPGLDIAKGHRINYLVDGKVNVIGSQSTSAILTNIERGTHTLSARIVDENSKLLKTSNNIVINMYRYSSLHKKP